MTLFGLLLFCFVSVFLCIGFVAYCLLFDVFGSLIVLFCFIFFVGYLLLVRLFVSFVLFGFDAFY